jgi:hypothetical protein
VSARSRALDALADHFEHLRSESLGGFGPTSPPIYNAYDSLSNAADMARRTALENRWRERAARWLHIPWP